MNDCLELSILVRVGHGLVDGPGRSISTLIRFGCLLSFKLKKEPFFLGIAVFLYGITFSLNTGYAINPARDLGPRVFIQLVGFPRAFTRGNDTFDNYWWIPLLGPEL